MWAQELLEVQERDLRIRRWFKKIAELVVKHKNATVVRMLKTLFSNVGVNRARDEGTRHKLSFFDPEKLTKLWRNGLFAVESVVLRTRRSLGTVRHVLLGLNLSHNLRPRLDFGAAGSAFGNNSLNRHLVLCLT